MLGWLQLQTSSGVVSETLFEWCIQRLHALFIRRENHASCLSPKAEVEALTCFVCFRFVSVFSSLRLFKVGTCCFTYYFVNAFIIIRQSVITVRFYFATFCLMSDCTCRHLYLDLVCNNNLLIAQQYQAMLFKTQQHNHLLFFITELLEISLAFYSVLKRSRTGRHQHYTKYLISLCHWGWNVLWLGRHPFQRVMNHGSWTVHVFSPQRINPQRSCEGSSEFNPFPKTDIRPVCPVTLPLRTREVQVLLSSRRRMDNQVRKINLQHLDPF